MAMKTLLALAAMFTAAAWQQGVVAHIISTTPMTTPDDEDMCAVDPNDRQDCGWPGISREECLSRSGCCFDNSIVGTIWCFHDKDCDNQPADIVFVLDESGSIRPDNFAKQINFTKNVVNDLDVTEGKTHIGAMTFNSRPKVHFHLDEKHGATEITAALDEITQRGGGTEIHRAIRKMRNKMFTDDHQRPDILHIGIVITDGHSPYSDKIKYQANKAHAQGITMFAIGVGPYVDEEQLKNIASSLEYVFHVDNYDALFALQDILASTTC